MNKTQEMANKKLDQLQDLVTSLENAGYYDEADELQEYLLNPKANAFYIMNKFGNKLEGIVSELDSDGIDYRDEDGNKYEGDLKALEKITDVEIDYVGYKDVVKYDDIYMFYDNVLSRRMVRGYQWLGLSNIERDGGYNGQIPDSYINKWRGVKEKIKWMPRVQEFTLSEFNNMINKGWIDRTREEVISETAKHYTTYPSLEDVMGMIDDNQSLFEYENEGMKEMFKDKIDEEKDQEKNEIEIKIEKENNELRKLKRKAEKEAEELKAIAKRSCVF